MFERESRLVRCFSAVFPWLTPEEIRNVNAESSEIWDSLTAVTLVTVIEEEFGLEIPQEFVPQLDSFGDFLTYIEHLDVDGEQVHP
jgi:acyl carrier protein